MWTTLTRDPFRLFFPLGVLFLFAGVFIWVPRIWDAENYPVILHRTLVLNGFVTCFIGGFLFTAVPRFSQTGFAGRGEVSILFLLIVSGVGAGWFELEKAVSVFSGLTGVFILFFLLRRMKKRKADPPYSFLFLFVGLFLWVISSFGFAVSGSEEMKEIQYHGAVMAIILGVGSRLLPGIMGHSEIISQGKDMPVPPDFLALMVAYVVSFFLPSQSGFMIAAAVVVVISLHYWKLYKLPVDRTCLTISLWICAWCIVFSYLLRAFWNDGMIHGSHAFFINGLVLLSLLIGTRVIQSHGPKDKALENWKGLYVVTGFVVLSSVTRVTAYLLPEHYLSHLGYASILLILGVGVWSWKFLRFVLEVRS